MPKPSGMGERAPEDIPKKRPPARTIERRTQQIGEYAQDLLEDRLRTGKASPTEVVAAVRAYGPEAQANLERIKAQTAYLQAQRAKAESETVREDMFQRAMEAMGRYDGSSPATHIQ